MNRTQAIVAATAAGLLSGAVVNELRKPAAERTWEGSLAGVVPYDLRPPSVSRFRQRMWAPDGPVLMPHAFGVGWTINVGGLARRAGVI